MIGYLGNSWASCCHLTLISTNTVH